MYLIAGDIPVRQEFEPPCEFLLEVGIIYNNGTLKHLSNFIVADDLNAIKLLYQECKSNLLISNLPAFSSLTLEVDEVARELTVCSSRKARQQYLYGKYKTFQAQITEIVVA